MHEKVEGIIVSERDYGETSKILTVITKEYGLISMIAKGAKTMKSSLRSVTGKLCYGYFYIYYKKDKLSTLISVDVIDSLKHIKKDIGCISYASFLLELAEEDQRRRIYEEKRDDSLQGKGNQRGNKQPIDHDAGEMAAGNRIFHGRQDSSDL